MDKNIMLWTIGIVGGLVLLVMGFRSMTEALYEPSVAVVAFVCCCGVAVMVIAPFSWWHRVQMERLRLERDRALTDLRAASPQLPANTREVVLDPLSRNTDAQFVLRKEDGGTIRFERRNRRVVLEEYDWAKRKETRQVVEEETVVLERPGGTPEMSRMLGRYQGDLDQRQLMAEMAGIQRPSPTLPEGAEKGGAGGGYGLKTVNSRAV